jgi:indole-3-acetaldehyde oxidase
VTTTEGLGNIKDGYHAIHQRFAGFHASQCGFCTPGMCMSLYSSLVNADKDHSRPKPRDGFSKVTVSEAERAISGNLCRCTGYRPIVDACKSFAAGVDIEDLGFNSFQKKGDSGNVFTKLPFYSSEELCSFPEFLKTEIRSSVACQSLAGGRWHCPKSIEELCNLLDSDLVSANRVKLVSGNTSSGVYRDLDFHDHFIDLRGVPEMNVIRRDNNGIKIGAAITISRVIELLREENKSRVFVKLADHMEKVASKFIQNMASIGGNLVMAQRDQFESDIATILLGASSTVSILSGSHEMLSLTLEEFLQMPPCTNKIILFSIYIPSWISPPNVLFQTYRAASRPLGNAVAYINASFLAQILIDEKTGYVILDNIQLAFGAYGTEHAIRARKVEEFLKGKTVNTSTLLEAVRILRQMLVVKEGTMHAAYRISLAVSFLFKFLSPFTKGLIAPCENGCVVVERSAKYSFSEGSIIGNLHEENQILHSSKQKIELSTEHLPVGAATKKIGSEMQASGMYLCTLKRASFLLDFVIASFI